MFNRIKADRIEWNFQIFHRIGLDSFLFFVGSEEKNCFRSDPMATLGCITLLWTRQDALRHKLFRISPWPWRHHQLIPAIPIPRTSPRKRKKDKKNSDKPADKFCELHKMNIIHVTKNCFHHNKTHSVSEYEITIIVDEHVLFSATSVDWILDSGTTKHVCCNKAYFDHLKLYNTSLKWDSVNQISINDIDSIWFILFNNYSSNSFSAIRLKNVLFVFKLNINLLFLNKFWKNEYEIHFKSKLCQIKKNIAVINDIYWQNLTYFNFKSKTKKAFVLINFDSWHARMRHINQKILSKLSKTIINIKYSHKDSQTKHICKICAETNLISKIKKFSND